MSAGNEFAALLYSDVSTAGLEVLTTKTLLWVTNTFAHFAMGWIGWNLWHHVPNWRGFWLALIGFYVALQIIQMWSPGSLLLLAADGLVDMLVPTFGAWSSMWIAMRDVPEVDQ